MTAKVEETLREDVEQAVDASAEAYLRAQVMIEDARREYQAGNSGAAGRLFERICELPLMEDAIQATPRMSPKRLQAQGEEDARKEAMEETKHAAMGHLFEMLVVSPGPIEWRGQDDARRWLARRLRSAISSDLMQRERRPRGLKRVPLDAAHPPSAHEDAE